MSIQQIHVFECVILQYVYKLDELEDTSGMHDGTSFPSENNRCYSGRAILECVYCTYNE